MMKFLLISIILFLLLLNLSKAQVIDVNIKEVVDNEVTNIDYNSTIKDGKPFKVSMDLYNIGSVEYNARVKLDILDKEDIIFTGWSDERYFFPGNRKIYDLYWNPSDMQGKFKALVSVYFANEIKKVKLLTVEIKHSGKSPENIFEILDFKTYDDEVELLLKTNKTINNLIVIPSSYPIDWIFEQVKIDEFETGKVKVIDLKYKPSIWKESDVTISMVSEDGKYYASQSFTMKRETTFMRNIYGIINNLRVFFGI